MVSVCCSCRRVKIGNRWMQKTITGQVFTSGYCPECFKKTLAEIEVFCGCERKEPQQGRSTF